MTLRKKALLTVAGTALALVATLALIGRRTILDGALAVEEEAVAADVMRAVDAVGSEGERLSAVAADWAFWDDTYAFMGGGARGYVETYLKPEALETLRIDSLVFLAPGGEVVRVASAGGAAGEAGEVRDALVAAVVGTPQLQAPPLYGVAGVVAAGERPAVVASRPILTSGRQGRPRGALVAVRFLDPEALARTVRLSHLEAWMRPPGHPGLAAGVWEGVRARDEAHPVLVRPLTRRTVGGYVLLRGLAGEDAFILGVRQLRPIFVQAVSSLEYFLASLAVAGIVFAVLVTILLERLVLARLARLGESVRGVAGTRDASLRVPAEGGDEIGLLGREVNAMLAELGAAHDALRRAHAQLEDRVRERTAELSRANEDLERQIAERLQAEGRLRALTAELERQNVELRALDRVKDGLIRDVTHELKTPVAKQAMQIELLAAELGRRGIDAELGDPLAVMRAAVRRQRSVIQTILTLARLESGRTADAIRRVRLDEVLREAIEDNRAAADAAGVALELDAEPIEVDSDRDLLWHVFANLVSNAVKYRFGSRPHVRVRTSRNGGAVTVRVEDNGVGFRPEEGERLFERFYQGSAAAEGIGLGLAIVRRALDHLGGSIRLESPGPGRGATATVELPPEAPAGRGAEARG